MENAMLDRIESALSDNCLWAKMGNGRWWALRRIGKTQTWKNSPGKFRIPVKAGLKSCGEITDMSNVGEHTFSDNKWQACNFVIAPRAINPNN